MKKKVFPCSPDSTPALLYPKLGPVFLAHENPWFKVMSRGTYYTIEYERPQVVILPILGGDSIVMVRVKRPLIDDCPLELPAGDSDEGESLTKGRCHAGAHGRNGHTYRGSPALRPRIVYF